nr:reverse transcriptase domain-containing protein [Tanacetum cinerariifolium]
MTTRSAGRPVAASRGWETGGRAGRGGGRTKGRSGDQGDERPLVLPPPLPDRPPVSHPRDAATGRPALRVVIVGSIIHTRENMGNVRSTDTPYPPVGYDVSTFHSEQRIDFYSLNNSYGQRPYVNAKSEKARNPYFEVNNIFGRNYDTSNTLENQGHEEHRDDPTLEPLVCKIRRFEMLKYSFNAEEEYIAIKESEYLNHSKDKLDAYRELLRIIDEGWARSGFNQIEEFFLWMLSCQALNNCVNTNGNTTLSEAHGVSLRITSGVRVNPNRDGERGFDYLTSALVSSKAYREGCRALRGGFPYRGDLRAEEEGTPLSPLVECMSTKNALAIQRCELSRKELDEFLLSYSIHSDYRVILPTPTQTILDAPPGARAFDDPILFLASLQSSWEHGQQRSAIFLGNKEMSFRNFIYIEDDEDLTFLPKDFSPGFNTGSSFVSINTEPVKADEEPAVEPTTEPATEPVNERAKDSTTKDDNLVLSISDDDEDNHLDVDLLDLYDRCYARQAVVDNAVNRRSRKLLKVIKKLRGEANVMRARELAREEEYKGLRANSAEAKEYKGNLDRLMLESQKWSSYQVSLSDLESKVAYLEAEKANLEATKALLRQEIKDVKQNNREVVFKVVPYACMELLQSDELGRLVGKLVSSPVTFGRSFAIEEAPTLQKRVPSRTQMHVPSSQLATLSFAHALKPAHVALSYGQTYCANLKASILKKGRDLSALFDKKRLRAASFPLRLCISFNARAFSNSMTALIFKGLAFMHCLVIRCPKNRPYFTTNEHFFGFSFMLINRNLSKVSCMSLNIPSSEKGDPDNFLHLFKGAIRMQKWLMPVACHMFTYTLNDFERVWWNSQKAERATKALNHLPRCSKANDHEIPPRQLLHLAKGIKKEKAKSTDTPRGEGNQDKSTTPVEAPILMINREDYATKNTVSESMTHKEGITFPPVTRVSSALVILEAAVFERKVGRVYMDSRSTCEVIYKHCLCSVLNVFSSTIMVLGIHVISACIHAKMSALALSKFQFLSCLHAKMSALSLSKFHNSFLKCYAGYPFFADGKGPSCLLCFFPSFANRQYGFDSFIASPTESTVPTPFLVENFVAP